MYWEAQAEVYTSGLKGHSCEPIAVLGMVTLNDIQRMEDEGRAGRGWIACTCWFFLFSFSYLVLPFIAYPTYRLRFCTLKLLLFSST